MWFIFFALPEIQVRQATGNDLIAIAPCDDPRVKECISSSPYTGEGDGDGEKGTSYTPPVKQIFTKK
jgi:hypothetical protein